MAPATPQLPEVQLAIGDRVGPHYRVTRLLGHGGMGVVAEAVHEGHGSRVAIKVMHPRHLQNQEAVARFFQEGRAAARVRGEHSVRLFDMGTTEDGRPYLVMELLVGCDLAARIEPGAVPLADAALYILQACEGMAEVHAHGMVHRDLKPSNLFLARTPDDSPLVKVLDFGIAKGVAEAHAAPVARDDALGGTHRFDPSRRRKRMRLLAAGLLVLALGLVWAAVGAYQTRAQATRPPSARRGILVFATKAAIRVEGQLAEPQTPALVLDGALDAPLPMPTHHLGVERLRAPAGPPRASPSEPVPTAATSAPTKRFDPFDDRN